MSPFLYTIYINWKKYFCTAPKIRFCVLPQSLWYKKFTKADKNIYFTNFSENNLKNISKLLNTDSSTIEM